MLCCHHELNSCVFIMSIFIDSIQRYGPLMKRILLCHQKVEKVQLMLLLDLQQHWQTWRQSFKGTHAAFILMNFNPKLPFVVFIFNSIQMVYIEDCQVELLRLLDWDLSFESFSCHFMWANKGVDCKRIMLEAWEAVSVFNFFPCCLIITTCNLRVLFISLWACWKHLIFCAIVRKQSFSFPLYMNPYSLLSVEYPYSCKMVQFSRGSCVWSAIDMMNMLGYQPITVCDWCCLSIHTDYCKQLWWPN